VQALAARKDALAGQGAGGLSKLALDLGFDANYKAVLSGVLREVPGALGPGGEKRLADALGIAIPVTVIWHDETEQALPVECTAPIVPCAKCGRLFVKRGSHHKNCKRCQRHRG